MKITVNPSRPLFQRSPLIYGQFLEHFHRQIYGGVYMPGHPLSDADGFRRDVLEALRRIRVPVIRWPGGCFVSAYHWEDGVGRNRVPTYDKAWRVEESHAFGTDEFILLCRKLGCEPYICTNAGSGTQEEMSNWVEYCNLPSEGRYARLRRAGGHDAPYGVRYWSVGNENYLDGEIGSKTQGEWGRFVREAAKMMKRVDPGIELSAAAVAEVGWNVNLLKEAGDRLDWISIHGYWDELWQNNQPAGYEACMARTDDLERDVRKVRGLLQAFGLEKKIRIAYDEWNLRGWHHPNVDAAPLGDTAFLQARDANDDNRTYTMADAVFSACFLNMVLRNADIVGMANFAPVVNTRGCIFTHDNGLVLRPAYFVFDLYANVLGDTVVDSFVRDVPEGVFTDRHGDPHTVPLVDSVATVSESLVAVSLVNKHPRETIQAELEGLPAKGAELQVLTGPTVDAYNDENQAWVSIQTRDDLIRQTRTKLTVKLPPHAVCVLTCPR